jgi:ribosomal protein L3 glutamine methyltransferase
VKLRELLERAAGRFEAAGLAYGHGTTNALDEAAWILLHSLGLPVNSLAPHLDRDVTEGERKAAWSLVEQRIRTRKPAAYLLHEAWLGPHRFYVDERVIVPRSFIFEILEILGSDPKILDMCTGSGCLAILMALRWPNAVVDAVDLSKDALEVAARNVADYGLDDRVHLVQSDMFAALEGRKYDLIVSNPPYVKASSMKALPEEYQREPTMALASGSDGLDHVRTILAQARGHLNPKGRLLVEIGHNKAALKKAFPTLPFRWPRTSGGMKFVFELSREELPA